MRRNISKVGVFGEWRELAEAKGRWRSIVVSAGQKLGASPLIKGRGGEEEETESFVFF